MDNKQDNVLGDFNSYSTIWRYQEGGSNKQSVTKWFKKENR